MCEFERKVMKSEQMKRCQGDGGRCQAGPGWPHTEACKAEMSKLLVECEADALAFGRKLL